MIPLRANRNSQTARALRLETKDPRYRWPTQITSRSFANVCAQLHLVPDATRYRGLKLASIGEGFSDFAQTLERAGADVVAVDPLYGLSIDQLSQLWICGGTTGTEFGAHLRDASQVSDLERGSLTLTPEKALSRCVSASRRVSEDLGNLTLPTASYDLVCCSHVLVHLTDPAPRMSFRVDPRLQAGLEKMYSLLAPGGTVRCLASEDQYLAAHGLLRERHPELVQSLGPARPASTQRLWVLSRGRDAFVGPSGAVRSHP